MRAIRPGEAKGKSDMLTIEFRGMLVHCGEEYTGRQLDERNCEGSAWRQDVFAKEVQHRVIKGKYCR